LGLSLKMRVWVRAVRHNRDEVALGDGPNGTCANVAAASSCGGFPDAPVTLEEVFTSCVDIAAVPTRHFFHVLSLYAKDDIHRDKLCEFASRTLEGKNALYEYCKRERRSAAEVMWDFWSARPPLPELLSALPLMRARRYSIASCPKWYDPSLASHTAARVWMGYQQACGLAWRPRLRARAVEAALAEAFAGSMNCCAHDMLEGGCSFDLCVAVVRFTTKTAREGHGLCSTFLAQAIAGSRIFCSFEKGSLAVPQLDVPLILVCPGTGLSPCRALVQERHLQVCSCGGGRRGGGDRFSSGLRDLIFLGFRHREGDFLYGEEWSSFADWLTVHIAFSRDDPDRKVYVQDLIEEQGSHVCRLLDAGAHVFICGRSHPMPTQVFDAFTAALSEHRGLPVEAAAARLRGMQRAKHYICDTWG